MTKKPRGRPPKASVLVAACESAAGYFEREGRELIARRMRQAAVRIKRESESNNRLRKMLGFGT